MAAVLDRYNLSLTLSRTYRWQNPRQKKSHPLRLFQTIARYTKADRSEQYNVPVDEFGCE